LPSKKTKNKPVARLADDPYYNSLEKAREAVAAMLRKQRKKKGGKNAPK